MQMRHVEIDSKNEALQNRLQEEPTLVPQLQELLELSFLFHDNALEGIVLSPQDLQVAFDPSYVADRGEIPGHAALRHHKAALDFIRADALQEETKLSMDRLVRLHGLLSAGGALAEAPQLRREVPAHRIYFHEIVPPQRVAPAMEEFLELPKTAEFKELPVVDRAATLHWHFMRIFPFGEQNGRIARLLTQEILLREGYPLLVIHASDRQRYFEGLSRPLPLFRTLMREAMEYSLVNALRFCGEPKPPKPARKRPSRAKAEAPSKAATKPPTRPVADKKASAKALVAGQGQW